MQARQRMRSGRGDVRRRIRLVLAPAMVLLMAAPAFAALPPVHERAREMTAILNSPDLNRALGANRPVDAIERVAPDLYRIRAGDCSLEARIADRPRDPSAPLRMGPREFMVELGPLACGTGR